MLTASKYDINNRFLIGTEKSDSLAAVQLIYPLNAEKQTQYQLLQLCTARTACSDSVIRSETNLITESDRSGPIR